MMQMPSYLLVLKNNTKKILKILLISKNEHSKNFNFAVRAIHKMVYKKGYCTVHIYLRKNIEDNLDCSFPHLLRASLSN